MELKYFFLEVYITILTYVRSLLLCFPMEAFVGLRKTVLGDGNVLTLVSDCCLCVCVCPFILLRSNVGMRWHALDCMMEQVKCPLSLVLCGPECHVVVEGNSRIKLSWL